MIKETASCLILDEVEVEVVVVAAAAAIAQYLFLSLELLRAMQGNPLGEMLLYCLTPYPVITKKPVTTRKHQDL